MGGWGGGVQWKKMRGKKLLGLAGELSCRSRRDVESDELHFLCFGRQV